MNVTVVYKWGFDPDDAFVSSDGRFKWKRGKLAASDDDAATIGSARKLTQATGGKLSGVTVGNGDATWAAARGAEELLSSDACMPSPNDAVSAGDLADAIKASGAFDVVAIGDAIERAGVAPVLAAKLGVPCVCGVKDFEADEADPSRIIAHRDVPGGIETIRFVPPVLISVAAATSEKEIPTMKQVLAGRKTPVMRIETHSGSDDAVDVAARGKAPLTPAKMFEGTPREAARALVAQLRSQNVL